MTSTRNCTTTGGSSHVCSLIDQDSLSTAESYLYIGCNLNENSSSSSGDLRINLTIVLAEADGDSNIELGINQSTIGGLATTFSEKRIYVRTANNTQSIAKFDKIATYGNQVWAINYISSAETTSNFTYTTNITPIFYVYEITNLSSTNIITNVKQFINSTRQ